ncbi:hypothetical protein C1I95_10225 [Micromonospora craterilacus]|uniref:Alpha/beta hydrolase n=1 Tax=Micromonospora craterilacus TaxID=1655439 RepID=A0A2W2E7S2_9ACTN|nr:hypothetical protein [Micromonospora craterilacus]PZG20122.1 hypothetical protein C1I95_10225 [Micromonospora craterilacus]
MITTSSRPDVDPELAALLAEMPLTSILDEHALAQVRPDFSAPIEPLRDGRSIDQREFVARAADGAEITLSVFRPAGDRTTPAPCVYWIHGGGMIMGDRFANIDIPVQAELHVWAGGVHGFDALFPQTRIGAAARRTRTQWLARALDAMSAEGEI